MTAHRKAQQIIAVHKTFDSAVLNPPAFSELDEE
jgi:hypothetical protein